jgi:transcriptional regulator with XRE-family HTH domain
MFADLLRRDRERSGLSAEEAARRLGVSRAVYREIEASERWPEWEMYDRICKTFGWPRSFVGQVRSMRRLQTSTTRRRVACVRCTRGCPTTSI